VLKVFHEQIKNSEEIRVTDLKMRRFFIDINKILEYLDFIFKNVK
jgi:FlaA1/EpsC-like NDP-sugar epimerase